MTDGRTSRCRPQGERVGDVRGEFGGRVFDEDLHDVGDGGWGKEARNQRM